MMSPEEPQYRNAFSLTVCKEKRCEPSSGRLMIIATKSILDDLSGGLNT